MTPCKPTLMQLFSHPNRSLLNYAELLQRCFYSTTAATAAKAPAAPIPIAAPLCTAAPVALVDALVVLPVCVCVPPVELVEPPFDPAFDPPVDPPVVDAVVDEGVDAVLVTEPAVITTGIKETSVPERVVDVRVGTPVSWVRIAPDADAVHTAIEVPERTQFMDATLPPKSAANIVRHGD